MSVGYGTQPQFRFDIEHPASLVMFGAEVTKNGASVETKYTYGTDSQVTKLPTPVIAGGESYVLTLPLVTEGLWKVTAKSNFGHCIEFQTFTVALPDNSLTIGVPPP